MGIKLPPNELDLYLAIDALLLNDWDPIGVSGIEEAKDEYHAYLPQMFKMVMNDSTPANIAEYLHTIVTERMGLSSNIEHETAIAKKALSFKSQFGVHQTLTLHSSGTPNGTS